MSKSQGFCALLLVLTALYSNQASAFTLEDFEGLARGATSFSAGAETFSVSSVTGEGYDIFLHDTHGSDTCVDCGWNGSIIDQQFLDNSGGGDNGAGNGSSFTIEISGSDNFFVQDLFIFCATAGFTNPTGTLSITGKRNDVLVYTILINTFSNVVTLAPNNGYTHVNFATDGMDDYTDDPVDELIFTSTGDLDYMSLDAFTWEGTALPVELQSFSID